MSELSLGELKIVDARTLWNSEERDFTPWLCEHISEIANVIGLPLIVQQKEKRVGRCELDIFAKVADTETAVIIENQITCTDHKHLGQLITYAGGLEAAVIVWIATEVRDEHKAAIDWLNRSTHPEIRFFIIRPEILRIDDSKPAVKFLLEAAPSEFTKSIRTRTQIDQNGSQEFRKRFWIDLLAFLESRGHGWAQGRQPLSGPAYLSSPVGKAGVGVNVSFAFDRRIRVEIYCGYDPEKTLFEALYSHKGEIEAVFPDETVQWERLEGTNASRVAVYRSYDRVAISENPEERNQLFAWIEKNVSRFRPIAIRYLVK